MLKLRKFDAGEPLVVAMTAIRMGDRLLVVGCSEPKFVAQLAAKPGITGHAAAVDDAPERTARAAAAAEREGALLESQTTTLTGLPFDADSFDVVVVSHLLPRLSSDQQSACLREAARVLRAGGRCVVLQPGRRSGISGLLGGSPAMSPADVEAAMSGWFRAVRTIAERDGLLFVEGAR